MHRNVIAMAAIMAWTSGAHLFAAPPAKPVTVNVKHNPDSPTAGIQEAIDGLGSDGGIVAIPAGEYRLRRSVRVRSHLVLQGAGDKTVLIKSKQIGSKLAAKADANSRSITVQSAAVFRAGDEIGIYDGSTVGWLHAHAIVKEVRGNDLLLDRRIGRAFDPAGGAAVVNYFAGVSGQGMTKFVLKDLTIDGQAQANPGPAVVCPRPKGTPAELGFTFAAVNLLEMTDGRVERCRVTGWPADGISVQKGCHNVVTKCVVENCRGPGFHAGGHETDSEFIDNQARGNLGDGFYFCAFVTRVTVKDNKFVGNKGNGIGDLGHGGDQENTVENNLCRENGESGISVWDGESNTVKKNTCVNNSQSLPGRFSGIVLSKTAKSKVMDNRCYDDQKVPTQKYGIQELSNCRGNTITGNDCRGAGRPGLALAGKDGVRNDNRE